LRDFRKRQIDIADDPQSEHLKQPEEVSIVSGNAKGANQFTVAAETTNDITNTLKGIYERLKAFTLSIESAIDGSVQQKFGIDEHPGTDEPQSA
jgi:hypothetical protein